MDAAAAAALCLMLARSAAATPPPPGVACPSSAAPSATQGAVLDGGDLAARIGSPDARAGIGRVAFAEAGNQGDSGLAGVIYTILNRLADGRWGGSVDAVLNAPGQFEPVMRAGGDWRRLPAISDANQARVDTILNLALEGRLPDLTHGARYFQNPAIVAARARAGRVRTGLVDFGGQTPSAVIGAHSFYGGFGERGASTSTAPRAVVGAAPESLFIGPNRGGPEPTTASAEPANDATAGAQTEVGLGDPGRGLFVSRDGLVRADQR